jgi:hypothetical protein
MRSPWSTTPLSHTHSLSALSGWVALAQRLGQPFAITEFDAQGNFLRLVETGQTQTPAPVPEPGTFVLLSIGLVGLLGWSRVVQNARV